MHYLLSDIAKKFGIPVSTLRYYEKTGALPFLRRNANRYFLVDKADITSLYLLQCLRNSGCPVKTIVDIMKKVDKNKRDEGASGGSPDSFASILQLLCQHSDELMRQQQLLLWQTQVASIRSVFTLRILCEQNRFIRSELTTETNIPFSNKAATTGQW